MKIFLISLIAITVLPCMHALAAEPITLEKTWISAYQNNPSLEAARAKLRATDEQVSQALSHWRPSIDATANVGKTYASKSTSPISYNASAIANTSSSSGGFSKFA